MYYGNYGNSLDPYSDQNAYGNLSGTQPLSRVGEIVQNAIVDPSQMSSAHVKAKENAAWKEVCPRMNDWLTVMPGYICLASQKRPSWRGHAQGESLCPVIAAAYGYNHKDDLNTGFTFAGVARSRSVKEGGLQSSGATLDVGEPAPPFTLAKRGYAVVVNTSGHDLHVGDRIAWTFGDVHMEYTEPTVSDSRVGPRRIAIKRLAPGVYDINAFARVIKFARAGPANTVDILIDTNN
jgi:hypothetical protein